MVWEGRRGALALLTGAGAAQWWECRNKKPSKGDIEGRQPPRATRETTEIKIINSGRQRESGNESEEKEL